MGVIIFCFKSLVTIHKISRFWRPTHLNFPFGKYPASIKKCCFQPRVQGELTLNGAGWWGLLLPWCVSSTVFLFFYSLIHLHIVWGFNKGSGKWGLQTGLWLSLNSDFICIERWDWKAGACFQKLSDLQSFPRRTEELRRWMSRDFSVYTPVCLGKNNGSGNNGQLRIRTIESANSYHLLSGRGTGLSPLTFMVAVLLWENISRQMWTNIYSSQIKKPQIKETILLRYSLMNHWVHLG